MGTIRQNILIMALLFCCSAEAFALGQIEPATLSYQGMLADSAGVPMTGIKQLQICLYDNPVTAPGPSGPGLTGTAFWCDSYSVLLKNGQFAVVLGRDGNPLKGSDPLTAFSLFNGTTYVGVRVDANPEMTPRQKLTSVAYAFHSINSKVAEAVVPTNYSSIIPPGTIVAFGGLTPPNGWLLCDGSSKLTADYPALFAAIGNIYGGSGTIFTLPNATGRTLIMAGTYADTVSGTVTRNIGQSLGAEKHTLTIAEMPAHTHTQVFGSPNVWGFVGGSGGTNASQTGSTGGSGPHNNMQPSLVVNYIIKY